MSGGLPVKAVKAQLSIEFFLAVSVVLAFILILYGTAMQEVQKNKVLEQAVLGQAFLNSLSSQIEFVAATGNASVLTKEFFVPSNLECLYVDQAKNRLYCLYHSGVAGEILGDESSVHTVYGPPLTMQLDRAGCAHPRGWTSVSTRSVNGNVSLSC